MKHFNFTRHTFYALVIFIVLYNLRVGLFLAQGVTEAPKFPDIVNQLIGLIGIISALLTLPIWLVVVLLKQLGIPVENFPVLLVGLIGILILTSKKFSPSQCHLVAYLTYVLSFFLVLLPFDYIDQISKNRVVADLAKPDAMDGFTMMMGSSAALCIALYVAKYYSKLTSPKNQSF